MSHTCAVHVQYMYMYKGPHMTSYRPGYRSCMDGPVNVYIHVCITLSTVYVHAHLYQCVCVCVYVYVCVTVPSKKILCCASTVELLGHVSHNVCACIIM